MPGKKVAEGGGNMILCFPLQIIAVIVVTISTVYSVFERRGRIRAEAGETRMHNLLESISDWVWEVDADMRYTYVSPVCRELLGYEPEELLGRSPLELMPASEAQRVATIMGDCFSSRSPFSTLKNRNRRKDGSHVILETSGVPFFDSADKFAGYRGIDRDITDLERTSESVILSEKIFNHVLEGIAVTDSTGCIQKVNRSFTAITGYSEEEVVGKNPRILKSDLQDDGFYAEMWRGLLSIGFWAGEIWNRNKMGETYAVWLSISAIYDESGAVKHFVSLFHEITGTKNS